MIFETWLTFTLASAALLAIPGPTITLVVSYVLGKGARSAFYSVPGVVLGDFTAMSISLLGAGAVLQTSATLFTIMKLTGALYLVYLGISLWRNDLEVTQSHDKNGGGTGAKMFWNTYVVTSLNPKGIVFFIAFLPQFINPAMATLPQFVIMEITFLVLATLNILVWVMLAEKFRTTFQNARTRIVTNRIGGSFLIGAGVLTAFSHKSN